MAAAALSSMMQRAVDSGLDLGEPNSDDIAAVAASRVQELEEPAAAIVERLRAAVAETQRLGLAEAQADIERAAAAAARFQTLIKSPGQYAVDRDGSPLPASRQRHDLKTPLSGVIGYAELIIEEYANESGAAELVDSLKTAASLASGVTSSIDTLLQDRDQDIAAASSSQDEEAETPGEVEAADSLGIVASAVGGAVDAASLSHQRASRARILTVDDDPDSRELLYRRLGKEGHRVIQASSGKTALEKLSAKPVDLVLLDLVMPDLNGIQVLQRMKSDPALKNIPVIVVSGQNEVASAIQCIEAGAEDYLSKPFNPILLRARVNASLERKRARDREQEHLRDIGIEKARADSLLRAILPETIVARLKLGETVIADRFDLVSVLFCDLVGFTAFAANTPAPRVVEALDQLFSIFDGLCRNLGVEKIKTIGDAYMAAAGLPHPHPDHAAAIAKLGLGMLDAINQFNRQNGFSFQLRIGIHTGPVVAGIIGRDKFIYDVWGDTVNTASRLESAGVAGCVQVSGVTRNALKGRFAFRSRGRLELAGLGKVQAFLLAAL
jgi:adenylate cyclase